MIMNLYAEHSNHRLAGRILGGLLLLALILAAPLHALAEETDSSDPAAELEVPCLIVVDQNDPAAVIYEKNADQRCIPGSTMKIMTCILALELCDDLDQEVVVTTQAALLKDSNSLMGVIKGETLTVRELLYGLMLMSGNDAALLLAQALGGSTEAFVALMNEKAATLGMTQTHFLNPSGAYKRDQYSTARDMAVLTCYAMQNETFREISSTVRYTIEPNGVRTRTLNMINSNKLISDEPDSRLFYEFATGVKTGSTAQGGKCLVASASRNETGVVAVLLGVKEGGSKLDRMTQVYEDAKYIMDLALSEGFLPFTAADLGLNGDLTLPVSGALGTTVSLRPSFSNETILLTRAQADKIKANPGLVQIETSVSFLTAPVSKGDSCAEADYRIHGRTLFAAELIANESLEAEPSGLDISTVATPTPKVEQEPDSLWILEPPVWFIALLAAGAIAALALLFFLIRKRKKR